MEGESAAARVRRSALQIITFGQSQAPHFVSKYLLLVVLRLAISPLIILLP